MDSKEFVEWLKKENLFATVDKNHHHFQNIFKNCLDVKPHEEVLLIGDIGYPTRRVPALVLGCYLLAAKRLGLKYKFAVQKPKERGDVADENVVEALLGHSEGNVVIWSLSGRVGSLDIIGKSFRKFVQSHNHRFISTPSLGLLKTQKFNELIKAVDVDYIKMMEDGKKIKERIDTGKEIRVITDKGTNLFFDITLKNSISNDGSYREQGIGGNLPAGEVYVAPRKKGVNGTVVIDACSRNIKQSLVVKHPIKLKIEDGAITQIEGKEEAKALESALKWAEQNAKYPWGIRRVGEFGIGINPGARITDSTLISEKTVGTAHIGIGSNYWFGGTIFAIIHLDQVFRKPKIWVDGEKLVV